MINGTKTSRVSWPPTRTTPSLSLTSTPMCYALSKTRIATLPDSRRKRNFSTTNAETFLLTSRWRITGSTSPTRTLTLCGERSFTTARSIMSYKDSIRKSCGPILPAPLVRRSNRISTFCRNSRNCKTCIDTYWARTRRSSLKSKG